MIDKNGGQYKHSMTLTKEERDTSIYIDSNIHYIPKVKDTKFGRLVSKPNILDFCKFTNNKCLYTGLVLDNFMGFSTQVPARTEVLIEKEIKHPFPHTIQREATEEEKKLFSMTQAEYNIYYVLEEYYNRGREDHNYSLFVYRTIKNSITKEANNTYYTNFRVKKEIDLDKILSLSSGKVREKWESLEKVNFDLFMKMCEADKIAYYLHWTNDKGKYYEKFYDRFYDSYQKFSEEEMKDIINKIKKLSKDQAHK